MRSDPPVKNPSLATGPLEIWAPATNALLRTREATPSAALPDTLRRARAAQQRWAELGFRARAAHLLRVVDCLRAKAQHYAEQIAHYNGKTLDEALVAEVFPTLATFRYFARTAAKHLRARKLRLAAMPVAYSVVHYEPLGVIGVITPWNYPFKIALQDVPAALMAGNAVVLKMSEHSTAIGELIEQLLQDSGLPPQLVQVIYGFGDLGQALIEAGVDKIVFTGSTQTGRKVYEAAARRLIPCALELGGKDAAIVLEDADLDEAARGILWAGLANCGQTCASVEQVFVPEPLKDTLVGKLSTLLRALPPGSVGTMNVKFQRDKVRAQLDEARQRGAKIVAERAAPDPTSKFEQPAVVLTDVPKDCALWRDETFGPVIPVAGYTDLDAVLREVNAGPFGLTASLWTQDRRRGERLARQLDTGVVTINEHMVTSAMPEAPWLGRKQSGLGLSMSAMALPAFCKLKYVYHDRGLVRFKFWRYPPSPSKRRWLGVFLEAQFARSRLRRWWANLRVLPRLLAKANPRFEE